MLRVLRRAFNAQVGLVCALNHLVPPELVHVAFLQPSERELYARLGVSELLTVCFSLDPFLARTAERVGPFGAEVLAGDPLLHSALRNVLRLDSTEPNAPTAPQRALSDARERPFVLNENVHSSLQFWPREAEQRAALRERFRLFWRNWSAAPQLRVAATLAGFEAHDYRVGAETRRAVRLEGRAAVRLLRPLVPGETDLEALLRPRMEARLALRSGRRDSTAAEETRLLREALDPASPHFLFRPGHDLWAEMSRAGLRPVEFTQEPDAVTALAALPAAAFARFAANLAESFAAARALSARGLLFAPAQAREVPQDIDRTSAAALWLQLVALLTAARALTPAQQVWLAAERSPLLRSEYLRLHLQGFARDYVAHWQRVERTEPRGAERYREVADHLRALAGDDAPGKRALAERVRAVLVAAPPAVATVVRGELERFLDASEHESDFHTLKGYLEYVAQLPLGVTTRDTLQLQRAARALGRSHFALDEVKRRVLEFVSVARLRGSPVSRKVLCLVGPPGVGKTSVAKAVAESLGRRFARVALGGESDPAVLRGHRRTYVAAAPGKLAQALRLAGASNPVILLDEIDKLGIAAQRGSVQDALLEVLDPAQNHSFSDHYLEFPLDLSRALFLCSANSLDGISAPLRDRLEVLELPGYALPEKRAIFRKFLLPKLLRRLGLAALRVRPLFPDALLRRLLDDYAREPGVRSLEKAAQRLLQRLCCQLARGERSPSAPFRLRRAGGRTLAMLRPSALAVVLGPRRFCAPRRPEPAELVGFAYALAYNALGGSVLSVEVLALPAATSTVTITGSLGAVMRESVETALAFARRFAFESCASLALERAALHLHFPEGASPKDGPSAGVSVVAALLSLALRQPFNPEFALSGEIALNGHVLRVGGLREKVLAARREGLRHVVLPHANRPDVAQLKPELCEGLSFHFVRRFEEVFELLFTRPAEAVEAAQKQQGQTISAAPA